jgi:hypothetical protein
MSLHVKVYKAAKKDIVFREEFLSIEGNSFPIFAGTIQKGVIASFYCGWLVGRFGVSEGMEIYNRIKS